MISRRKHDKSGHGYVDPSLELNLGLWSLFAGASVFLALRTWIKVTRRHGLWWDDYILLVAWVILAANNALITVEFATGYVTDTWDDRMHILINVTSCGTLVNQALTKTAFAVTLLKLTKNWGKWILWYCIVSMNLYMAAKVFLQWAKVCNKSSYDVWYRLPFCIDWHFRDNFKEGGNIYNIIMDFVLAVFPWAITWKLDMRKVEKIGLCIAMSLGMIVAVISAVRTGWKDDGNEKDEWYFWRNAHSNIWYSSEIVGTIIVQCIPVLRPLLRDFKTSLTSKKLASIKEGGNTTRCSRYVILSPNNTPKDLTTPLEYPPCSVSALVPAQPSAQESQHTTRSSTPTPAAPSTTPKAKAAQILGTHKASTRSASLK
ncbi:hypothetical protein TUN199_04974 [Pyrenophora tritici-repentis]|nr:hypothetical protein Alg215_08699 [Pyrenophora tritici-repentis]KAI0585490.1 hypothetical protein Alg130_04701 [Pyrenophora tritici-repentis]KAI0611115.1 hypothetical protein TUN205_04630 [Pyrenophora tritici-repentis]KAI0623020.1 hypothetical protein TUN199_04974 [Pyrenophora tritici-repentis]